MKNKFETMMNLVDEVEHIKEKISFMGEVFAAVAKRLGKDLTKELDNVTSDIETEKKRQETREKTISEAGKSLPGLQRKLSIAKENLKKLEDQKSEGFCMSEHEQNENAQKHKKYHFFGDAKRYESEKSSLTGADIKAIAGVTAAYQLFLEGEGDTPDKPIADSETVVLKEGEDTRHFYAVPPATFGAK